MQAANGGPWASPGRGSWARGRGQTRGRGPGSRGRVSSPTGHSGGSTARSASPRGSRTPDRRGASECAEQDGPHTRVWLGWGRGSAPTHTGSPAGTGSRHPGPEGGRQGGREEEGSRGGGPETGLRGAGRCRSGRGGVGRPNPLEGDRRRGTVARPPRERTLIRPRASCGAPAGRLPRASQAGLRAGEGLQRTGQGPPAASLPPVHWPVNYLLIINVPTSKAEPPAL